MVGLAFSGERWRSLSPLFTTAGKLPFPYLNTYWDCPGSYPRKLYWYFPKPLSDADVCEEFPTAPVRPFICLACSHTCSFAGQVENERNCPAPYEVGVYFSFFSILETPLGTTCCRQTGLGRHSWAGMGPCWEHSFGTWRWKCSYLLWMGWSSPFLHPLWSPWPQLLRQDLSSTSYLSAELFWKMAISLLPSSMPPVTKVLLWWIDFCYQYLIVLCWCCREKDTEETVPV